ncbi:hypothetical protein E2986_06900 [Frieseomelitta varia]|uniref:NADP-dependent oxidoreductase domain-containing protein n=1 Tax=Frieseomelitta varia TaxID=561572 RepID=A0A833RS98_9HYME|nr:hypothetical protein E2986_06900 [Frieseomelitta varia]
MKCHHLDLVHESLNLEVTQAVKDAIVIGYRYIDCAHVYGNEKEVGDVLKAKIYEDVVKRQHLSITSKLWNTFHRPDLIEPTRIRKEVVFFPHNADNTPALSNADYVDTWKAMEALVSKGLVKNIGLQNKLNAIHIFLKRKLSEFCIQKGTLITAYSPLGSPDRPWTKPDDPKLLEDQKLGELAKKYNKTLAQIPAGPWSTIVISKSVTKSRIAQNSEVFNFKLPPEDIDYIDTFDYNGRICPMLSIETSSYYSFHILF